MLRVPPNGDDDGELLRNVGERVMQIQFDAESLHGTARDQQVIERLKLLEAEYSS